MKEKLRRKAELQKQSTKPMSFKESMEMEKKKQKELSKSKEDRRNALCEELGRGCQLVRALENKLAWDVVAKFNPELI